MTQLLELREKIKDFYGENSVFLLPFLKFLLAFAVFKGVNLYLPYVEILDNIFLLLVLSLICCMMPMNCTATFGILLIIGQCYGVSLETAGFAVCLFLILIILYIRFTPQDAIVLVLTPLAFVLKVPCAVPIGYGLTRSPASAISAAMGVVVYYFLDFVHASAGMLKGTDSQQIADNLKMMLDGVVKNQNMMMNIIAFVTVLLMVNVIRRLSVNYAWQIAIFTGGIAYIVIMIAGGLTIEVENPVGSLILGTIGAVLISLILEFFLLNVDYTRTEFLQYEDDEYYYYVKAVPKRTISRRNVVVKTIGEDAQEPSVPQAGMNPERQVSAPVPDTTISFPAMAGTMAPDRGMREVPQEPSGDMPEVPADFEKKLEDTLKDL